VGLGVKGFGPLSRYGLLRVKWTVSVNRCVSGEEIGPLLRYVLLRVKWIVRCEELVGLGVKRFGPLLRYGLLRVKWTISVKRLGPLSR
jgi:hypothetical protein